MPVKSKENNRYDVLSLVQTPIVVIDPEYQIKFMNEAGLSMFGKKSKGIVGKKCYDVFKNNVCRTDECGCKLVMKEGVPAGGEAVSGGLDDAVIRYFATPLKDNGGKIAGCVETIVDVTELKQLQQKTVQMASEILEISTPIMQVWEGVVVAPLIGMLDSERTARFMERLLNAIVETNSSVALVDITGVPTVDTQTGQHLIEAITASKLLGARVILTGVKPVIAQTLVHLGIDLSSVDTRSSLAAGLQMALKSMGSEIISGSGR